MAENVRYQGTHGGLGNVKTRSFALMTGVKGYQFAETVISGVILCARELMNSLDDSSMEEVKQAVRSVNWLNDYYDIGQNYIRTKNGLISYVFRGLRHNLYSIKLKARILICWVDKAENLSKMA
nr:phage terminase large subunit [Gilliamella apicola]